MTKVLVTIWISIVLFTYGALTGHPLAENIFNGIKDTEYGGLILLLAYAALPYVFFGTTVALAAKFGAMPLIGWLLNTKK